MTPTKVAYEDTPVKLMLYPALVFMLIGMTVGLFISINGFLFPDYFSGEYIHFGRVRPVHVGTVLILWLISADFGFLYFMSQRLCGIPLQLPWLANIAAGCWWTGTIISIYSLPYGTNYGWEYAEFPMWVSWIPTKPLMLLGWIFGSISIFATVAKRKFEKMYVSLWYTMGTLLWGAITILIGQYSLEFLPGGISRVNNSWFYVHNLVGLIFTPMGLAQAYYFLPKLANTPIYSHRLSMLGFWSIAFFYAWIGTHHMIHGPVSQWLQTTAIIFSIWLFIPVFAVVTNLLGTLEPQWNKYIQNAGIRFLIMGVVFYLITCIQGPLMALRNINEITSKTDWVIGHSHVSLFATFTFFATAGMYYAIPVMTRKPLWSQKLADWHFSLSLFGTIPFILSLWIGGFLQGMMWANWANGTSYAEFHSNLSQFPFLDTITATRPWWILRSIGGAIILVANFLFVFNIFNTIILRVKSPVAQKIVEKVAPA